MRKSLFAFLFLSSVLMAQNQKIVPILSRVSPQDEFAKGEGIIDNQWVAVGTKTDHAIGKDFSNSFLCSEG